MFEIGVEEQNRSTWVSRVEAAASSTTEKEEMPSSTAAADAKKSTTKVSGATSWLTKKVVPSSSSSSSNSKYVEVDPFLEDVPHAADIVVIGGGGTFFEAVRAAAEGLGRESKPNKDGTPAPPAYTVTAVIGNPFVEWSMAYATAEAANAASSRHASTMSRSRASRGSLILLNEFETMTRAT